MITTATATVTDAGTEAAEAIGFLNALFEPEDIIEFRPIRTGEKSPPQKWTTLAGVEGLMPWMRQQERAKRHIYFGANPRRRVGGGVDGDVLLARYVFADFDKGATLDHALARIKAARFPHPTILVKSGGGIHAWWRLVERLDDMAAWKSRQKMLAKALGSDSTVCNPSRVMRVPGFVNWKYPEQPVARVVEMHPERRYGFDEVIPTLDLGMTNEEREAAEAVAVEAEVEAGSMGDVSRRFIYSGRLLPSGGRRDTMFAVACDLKARGWDEREATRVLMERMGQVGLTDDELADCPRQIHNAFTGGREPLPTSNGTAGLNGHARTEAATKKAEQREKKKAEQATAVIEAIGTNAAEPLDLRKPHTHDEVSCARRLAAAAAGSLRYVAEWRKWIQFDGQRWRIDDGGAAIEAAKRLRDSLWSEMPTLTRTEAEAAVTFVKGMGASKRLAGVVMLASSEPAIRVHAEELDRHPMLLNLRNGILDLNTLEMRPHDPSLLITQVAGVAYGETAESELWERFINDATDGNEELAAFLQRAAGVSLTGSVRDEVLYCHHGRGANGKSTYLDALRHVLGDYAAVAPPAFLAHRGTEAHPTEVAALHGKRLVAAIEMEAGVRMRESFVKSLTGGDAIQARRMREDFWTLIPTYKVHVSFNDPPRVTGTDDGIRRRLCVIPWLVRFDGSRRDSTLKERLCADGPERAGILNWAIGGLRAWQLRGLDAPACVKAFTEEFTRQQDSFGQFLDERCDVAPGHRVESQTFYREFHEWLERRGESTTTWTSNRVANELQRRGFVKEDRRTGGIHRGKYFYAGLGLLSALDE